LSTTSPETGDGRFGAAVFSGKLTSFHAAVFSGESTLFDDSTFVDVDMAMETTYFEPRMIEWGPISPRSSWPCNGPRPMD
jgi:hypothetical protein